MSEFVQNCPLCNHTENSPFDQREFRGRTVTNRLCQNCGLVFQSPRMTTAELDLFYEREYRELYQGEEGPSQKDISVQTARTISFVSFVGDHIDSLSSHLDIGSSTGKLLLSFQASFGTESVGVEPSDRYRKYAQARGLQIYPSLDPLKSDNLEPFNIISMAHVLEHLPDPVAYLGNLREVFLDPKGWLLIEVPNLYAHDSFEVAHLIAFSAHTLTQTLRSAGFEVVAIKKHGLPRSLNLPLYLTVLARPTYLEPDLHIRKENAVSIKRQLGMLRRRIVSRLFPKRAWLPTS